jgi:hypothetical protein
MANFKDTGKVGVNWGYLMVLPLLVLTAIPMWIAVGVFSRSTPAMPRVEVPIIEESWWAPSTWGAQESAATAAILAESAGSQAVASSFNSSVWSMSLTALAVTAAVILAGIWIVAAALTPAGRKEKLNTPAQQDRRLGELADRDQQRWTLNETARRVAAMQVAPDGRVYVPVVAGRKEPAQAGESSGAKAPKEPMDRHELAMDEEEVSS